MSLTNATYEEVAKLYSQATLDSLKQCAQVLEHPELVPPLIEVKIDDDEKYNFFWVLLDNMMFKTTLDGASRNCLINVIR